MSGETYADCWDVHDGPNPFNLRTHDMLTILLDELSAKRLTEGWCKSKHFGGFAHLQGRELFAHWAEEHRVHMIGQTASPAMQEWAVKQVLKPFFPDAG